MFLVTTNSSEQDIDASIRHADMREEAKDRVEMYARGETILNRAI